MVKDNKNLYLYMVLGAIGLVLVGIGAMRYQLILRDFEGYIITFLGFTLTISYVFYLEKKAGISKKVTWIKAASSIALFVIISIIMYP